MSCPIDYPRVPSDIKLVDVCKSFKRLQGKPCRLSKCTLKAQNICGELILCSCSKSGGRKCTRVFTTIKENISNSIVPCNLVILKTVSVFLQILSTASCKVHMNSLHNWSSFSHCGTGFPCESIKLSIFIKGPGISFALRHGSTAPVII